VSTATAETPNGKKAIAGVRLFLETEQQAMTLLLPAHIYRFRSPEALDELARRATRAADTLRRYLATGDEPLIGRDPHRRGVIWEEP
jgi:hypothetical protein